MEKAKPLNLGFVMTLAALAVPATVLLHELAHYLTALALGFSGLEFHALSIRYDRGNQPSGYRLAVTFSGMAMTAFLTLGAVFLIRRNLALGLAVLMAAPMRAFIWLLIGIAYLRGRGAPVQGDESTFSNLTGSPLALSSGASVGLLLGAIAYGVSVIAKQDRPTRFALVVGLSLGYPVGWAGYLLLAR